MRDQSTSVEAQITLTEINLMGRISTLHHSNLYLIIWRHC
jgi:hypothetical protein